jgi:hypothetical protein
MAGFFSVVSGYYVSGALGGWAERIRTGKWRTRVEPRSFRRRDRDHNVTDAPFCAPVSGICSDTFLGQFRTLRALCPNSADKSARRSAPGHDKKTSYLKLLRLFEFFACPSADTKKFAGTSGFSGCVAPLPRGCLGRTRRPNYDLTKRDWSRQSACCPFAKPTNNNSSNHRTLICLCKARLGVNAPAVLGPLPLGPARSALGVHVTPWVPVVKLEWHTTVTTKRVTIRSSLSPISSIASLYALDINFLNAWPAVPR